MKLKEEAMMKGRSLLETKPELKTMTQVKGKFVKPEVEGLCALLRGNVIPTTTLDLEGINT